MSTVFKQYSGCKFIWVKGFSSAQIALERDTGLYMLTPGASVLIKNQEHVQYAQPESLYTVVKPTEASENSDNKDTGLLVQNQNSYPVLFLLLSPVA